MEPQEPQSPEERKGSVIPAVGGGAVGGVAGGIWRYRNSQKKAAKTLRYEDAAHGTELGLVKEHITAVQKGHSSANGLVEEWRRLVETRMTEAPKRPNAGMGDSLAYKKAADRHYRRESKIYKLNNQWHEISGRLAIHSEGEAKHILQKEADALEASLHQAAAEHLVISHELKPLSKEVLEALEGATKKLPAGSTGKMLVGAAVVGGIGALASQAMFGRAERPHPAHAARIRQQQLDAQQQEQSPAV